MSLFARLRAFFGLSYYQGPERPHWDGKRFFGPGHEAKKGFGYVLKWRFGSDRHQRAQWPRFVSVLQDRPPQRVEGASWRATYVGQATVFVQMEGLNILTDPIWSQRASPFSWLGPKRVSPPGIALVHLPKVDVILISHNHYDHLDLPTLWRLWRRDRPTIYAPLGHAALIQSRYPSIEVTEMDWHESLPLRDGIDLHLHPNYHWSARLPWDRNRALWGAFVITSPSGNLYFAGDTGYQAGTHFKELAEKWGRFRLALIPIGAYAPRWFMAASHLDPQEAVQVMHDLGAEHAFAIHFETFQLTDEAYDAPRQQLLEVLKAHPEARFFIPRVGQSLMLADKSERS